MTVQELLSMVKSQATGRCVANIIPSTVAHSKVAFICPDIHWSCSVNMFELISAIKESHSTEMDALIMKANVMDDLDSDEMAYAVKDWLQTSRGSFGGGLGRGWLVEVI